MKVWMRAYAKPSRKVSGRRRNFWIYRFSKSRRCSSADFLSRKLRGYMFSWVRSGFREQSLQEKMKCKNFGYTEGHEDGYADGYAACFLKNFATSYFNGVQDGKKDLTQTIKNHFHKAVHLVRAEDVPIETVAETTDIPETLVEVFTAN